MDASFPVVFALYPGLTQLDFTGPLEVLWRLPGAQVTLASVEGGTVEGSGGVVFSGLTRLAEVADCALLCVPGGNGTIEALEDVEYIAELRRLAQGARYVTAVCTGSLLLGAAGLLRGRHAACHWAWRELLSAFGAIPDAGRVVRDGNLITGGGVTAGIDMALAVVAEIAGAQFAKTIQLTIEYAPAPPFRSGRPDQAEPEVLATVLARLEPARTRRETAVRRAAANLDAALERPEIVGAG